MIASLCYLHVIIQYENFYPAFYTLNCFCSYVYLYHMFVCFPLTVLDLLIRNITKYSKTCVQRPLFKRPKICFQGQLSLNAGQKYCRMLQGEHSAILLTFIKLPFVIKIFVLSIFEWPFYTGFSLHVMVFKLHNILYGFLKEKQLTHNFLFFHNPAPFRA